MEPAGQGFEDEEDVMRTTFLVGRVTRKGAEMVVVEGTESSPIPGPWTLRAVVRPALAPSFTTPDRRPRLR